MAGGVVTGMTPIVYVDDLPAARRFYATLGFEGLLAADDGGWAWTYLRCGEASVLLAAGDSGTGNGPVQFYCQTDDVDGLQQRLAGAGVAVGHMGHPEHAPGGEIRVVDPDGHALMIGQTTGAQRPVNRPDPKDSVLRRAAEIAGRRGIRTESGCQVGLFGGGRCPSPAEVKIVDSWGDSTWSCLQHAEELLFNVNSAFVASPQNEGITAYLARRRRMLPAQAGPTDDHTDPDPAAVRTQP